MVAELITLVALFQFVGKKFDIPTVQAAAVLVNACLGLYIGNRTTSLIANEILHRFPDFKHAKWVTIPLCLAVSIAFAAGSQSVIAGLILKETGTK
ncbi:hypothetical protein XarbCFBP7604_09785 [Xanthomonas arboricola]|nr:hypothetical protein XarbCFBP7604_09785 [Xanthomonas arboricola]